MYLIQFESPIGHFKKCIMKAAMLEPVFCKKWQKKFLTRNWFGEQGKSEGSEWYLIIISPK